MRPRALAAANGCGRGTDLWIVYNETLNTDRYALTPLPPLSQGRAVMVKYTHTLVW